jgi:hypothetical protein
LGVVVVKKLVLVLAALVGLFVVVKRIKDANDERELWHEATTAPDLR